MSDDKTKMTAWAALAGAAMAYARQDSKDTRQALSDAARAWASVGQPQRAETPGGGWTFRFGKAKGKTPGEVDVRDLRWYERCALEALDNPEKERWRESNQRDLDVIRAELRRRGEAGDW